MARRKTEIKDTLAGNDRVSMTLYLIYGFILVLAIGIVVKTVYIQLTYKVDPSVERYFRPVSEKRIDEPVRGNILATDGRLLALSTPMYQIYMDCTVLKHIYESDPQGGKKFEKEWRSRAGELAVELSALYRDRTSSEYLKLILDGRDNNRKYVKIGYPIDHETLQIVRKMPLFREGANKGGKIEEKIDTRQYPYGTLARRVIGYVKDNSRSEGNNKIGIEGRFDSELHGIEGYEWLRVTDDRKKVHDYDSAMVKARDGNDVRTTLNIDFQDIADRALRRQIEDEPKIQGACAMIMEVKTGAIRAMVNLQRDSSASDKSLQERLNLAIGQVGEQGSVFKTVTLMSLVEDGYVKSLEETLPTGNGHIPNTNLFDDHVIGLGEITVRHGFEISSNYVFSYLANQHYGKNPKDFYDKIYSYKLGERFDFDIEGLGTPVVPDPKSKYWSASTLSTSSYGYGISVTPLHVLMFYNAIANKGRMMKPYLVEDIEKDGKILKKYSPLILNTICSKATADTLTRALKSVTEEGTAKRLRGARLPVAGKTGTAQVALSAAEKPRKGDAYHDEAGRKKNQGTFVGFFPADDPKYTVLVTVFSYLSGTSFYGGTSPALAVKEMVDEIYAIDGEWDERIERKPLAESQNEAE